MPHKGQGASRGRVASYLCLPEDLVKRYDSLSQWGQDLCAHGPPVGTWGAHPKRESDGSMNGAPGVGHTRWGQGGRTGRAHPAAPGVGLLHDGQGPTSQP